MRVKIYEPNINTVAMYRDVSLVVLDEELTIEQYKEILGMFGKKLPEGDAPSLQDEVVGEAKDRDKKKFDEEFNKTIDKNIEKDKKILEALS
jgi:hypothetical protein